MNYKRLFLRILILALIASAGMGIAIFLFGSFDLLEFNLILTTLAVGGYSLTGLCCAAIHKKWRLFSYIGMIVSVCALALAIFTIWEFTYFDTWKALIISIILSVGTSHISLLLLIEPKDITVKRVQEFTILFIIVVAIMLIASTLNEFSDDEFYFRILGVFAILDVLGTITTPILNKMASDKNK